LNPVESKAGSDLKDLALLRERKIVHFPLIQGNLSLIRNRKSLDLSEGVIHGIYLRI
jgi:hypothetical protein